MRNYNLALFEKINGLVGRNKWLDAFGRAGAEFVVFAMLGWYAVSAWYLTDNWFGLIIFFVYFASAWIFGWLIDLGVGLIVREQRPSVGEPMVKPLFLPLMKWKSFPSDHAMTAFLFFFLALFFGLPLAGGLLILALWVAWGRIYAGVHYPLDIVGGACVAAFSAWLIFNLSLLI